MGWLLRYGSRELALRAGTYVLGRASECAVRVDDELASRRHAELRVEDGRVTLRDLGSRNGLYCKYRRLGGDERVQLASGDTFLIGSTSFVLLHTRGGRKRRAADTVMTVGDGSSVHTTALSVPHERFLAEADRAWARGDVDRCARATRLLLDTLASMLQRGVPPDEATLSAAAQHALQLAEERGVEWVDELVTVYDAGGLVPAIDMIVQLQRLFARRRWSSERLERYVERIRPVLDDGGPRGRALLQQLEALARAPARV